MNHCHICGGQGIPLGALGILMWFRCRQCGMDFSELNFDEESLYAQEEAEED